MRDKLREKLRAPYNSVLRDQFSANIGCLRNAGMWMNMAGMILKSNFYEPHNSHNDTNQHA
jgi:hypothetical protein